MKKLIIVLACSLCLSLNACTTTPEECDPSIKDPSLLDKMGCVFSGSYEKRVDDKKADLQALRQEQTYLTEKFEKLLDENKIVYGNLSERQRALDNIDEELYNLEKRLKSKQALNKDLEAKIENTRNQVEKMRQGSDSDAILKKKNEYEKILRECEALEASLGGEF